MPKDKAHNITFNKSLRTVDKIIQRIIFRKDSRHNFSVYFYMLYLTVGDDDIGLNILTFLPQVLLLVLLTYKYSSVYEVNFCIFCQTLVFVTFNKVQKTEY